MRQGLRNFSMFVVYPGLRQFLRQKFYTQIFSAQNFHTRIFFNIKNFTQIFSTQEFDTWIFLTQKFCAKLFFTWIVYIPFFLHKNFLRYGIIILVLIVLHGGWLRVMVNLFLFHVCSFRCFNKGSFFGTNKKVESVQMCGLMLSVAKRNKQKQKNKSNNTSFQNGEELD